MFYKFWITRETERERERVFFIELNGKYKTNSWSVHAFSSNITVEVCMDLVIMSHDNILVEQGTWRHNIQINSLKSVKQQVHLIFFNHRNFIIQVNLLIEVIPCDNTLIYWIILKFGFRDKNMCNNYSFVNLT